MATHQGNHGHRLAIQAQCDATVKAHDQASKTKNALCRVSDVSE